MNLGQAQRDKSLLEAADIPAFLAGENSASVGYGALLGELRLQVQEADVERARRVLDEHEGFSPLPDDFIPPEEPPRAARPPGGGAGSAFIWGAVIMVAAFGIGAALTFGAGDYAYVTVGGLVVLVVIGGLVGLAVRAIYNKGRTDASKTSHS